MATFEELFPDSPQARPFEPIVPGRSQLNSMRRSALDFSGGASPASTSFEDVFGMDPPTAPPPEQDTEWSDFGRAAIGSIGQLGSAATGATEYVARKFAGAGNTPLEQTFTDLAGSAARGRQASTAFTQDWFSSMTPEAQSRLEREVLTLDPNRTIWQGGPREFLSSVGLKLASSAAPTGVTLLPGALIMRAGLTNGAVSYLGASEGALSLGSIAANIAQEVEQAPIEELAQSQRFRELMDEMGPEAARQAFITEAQGYAPLVGGMVVGAISAVAGRYLEPVFTDKAGGMISRFGRGAISEGGQEAGQSSAEQIAQNMAAQIFDNRGTFEGVPEAAAQGFVVGGAMGGPLAAALGPRRRTALPVPGQATATPPSPEAPAAAPPAPARFEDVFGAAQPTEGGSGWRGGDIEFGPEPETDPAGQRLMALGPVNADVQAAMNAARDGLQSELPFGQQTPQEEQATYLQNPYPVQQMGLDLQQPTTALATIPQGPQQLSLPMERTRGMAPQPMVPLPDPPPADPDLSPPDAFRGAPAGLMGGRRGQILRERARTLGLPETTLDTAPPTFRDENQIDMFDQGPVGPDQPSAEPLTDLQAQLEDMNAAGSDRLGVYLSAANIEQLRRDGTFERIRGVGVPLANFDGRGGTLIAKDRGAAEELLSYLEDGIPMQEVLGLATGAGNGKPVDGQIAVQQRDEQGNVVRETLVADPDEADQLAASFDTGDREGVIISAAQAIKRRNQLIRQQSRSAEAERDAKKIRRTAEDLLTKELGDSPIADRALRRVGRKSLSENQAARRLVGYAARVRKKELSRRFGDFDAPEDLTFEKREDANQYSELLDQYMGAQVLVNTAKTAEETLKARARKESLRQQLASLVRMKKPSTPSQKLAKVARTLSPEETAKIEREGRGTNPDSTGKAGTGGPPKPPGSGLNYQAGRVITDETTRDVLSRATDDQLASMNDAELNVLFMEAAALRAGGRESTRALQAGEGTANTKLGGATTVLSAAGSKTIDDIIAAHPTRSEKIKLITRVQRTLAKRKFGAGKTRPITGRATIKGVGANRRPVRQAGARGELRPQKLFDVMPPREMSKADRAAHDARSAAAYAALTQQVTKFATAPILTPETAVSSDAGPLPFVMTDALREAAFAKLYARTLQRYAQLLQSVAPQSTAALKEVERFTKVLAELNAATPEQLTAKLAAAAQAEAEVQAATAARVDMEKLGFLKDPVKRRESALEAVVDLKERIARYRRLTDKWKTNSLFVENVEPLMVKLVGYVTRDTSALNMAGEMRALGYVPSRQEMEKLRLAMQRFRGSPTAREDLLKPLKRWFQELGFVFDGAVLDIDASLAGLTETRLLQKLRNRVGFEYTETPQERRQRERNAMVDKQLAKDEQTEMIRRARLTPEQRLREDRKAAVKAERLRRRAMSPEQRAAAAAMDRQGVPAAPGPAMDTAPTFDPGTPSRAELEKQLATLQTALDAAKGYSRAARARRAALRKVIDYTKRQMGLALQLMDITMYAPQLKAATTAVADRLENSAPGQSSRLDELLKLFASSLPADHPYQPLVQRLLGLNLDVIVAYDFSGRQTGTAWGIFGVDRNSSDPMPYILLNRPRLESARASGRDTSALMAHALMHEAVHAATAGTIANNASARTLVKALIAQTRFAAARQGVSLKFNGDSDFYGLQGDNPDEFIAEAFSNDVFQNVLREIKVEPDRSIWDWLLNMIGKLLGLGETPKARNMLEVVMSTADVLFTGDVATADGGVKALAGESVRSKIDNMISRITQSSEATQRVADTAKNTFEGSREGGNRFLLSALTMEQLKTFYAKNFGRTLTRYIDAFFERNADNSANMERADKLSREWTGIAEEDPASAAALSEVMTDASLYGIHPDLPLSDERNKSVKSAEQRARHADLSARFAALSEPTKALYQKLRSYYADTLQTEINLIMANGLRGALDEEVSEADVAKFKLNTAAGLEARYGERLDKTMREELLRLTRLPQNLVGPYFPLSRFGDYVVTSERTVETKTFATAKEAAQWAYARRGDDPTLSVGKPVETDDGFTVSVTEQEVRFAETPSEAEANRRELIERYGSGEDEGTSRPIVSKVGLRSQLYTRESPLAGGGLKTILGKLSGNAAAQAAIKDFYLRSLSDSAYRKHEIRRVGRRGVNTGLQHRAFANYAKSAAYYTSQLRFGHRMATAMGEMEAYVGKAQKGEVETDLSPVRMGEVVREIKLRDELTTNPVEVSKLVRGGSALTQFFMLTSPSYWMINAAQPYMVTLPWLAARSSMGKATAALAAAQRLIAHPIVAQMGESGGGLKALWSKSSAEKAFGVLDQVEEYIKQRAGDRGPEYIAMLNKLKRDSIIDLSFVAELRDIAEGTNTGWVQRTLDASRIMSHLTEVNNRILTAIAAYDLSRAEGTNVEQATDFAKQAVSLTQFNYSAGNAPRLFTAKGQFGQAGPLIFQFMKYPQHMYALLIDNFRVAVKSGAMPRERAIKTLTGLFATHLLAGGVVGAMLQPIKWGIGLMFAMFGDEEEEKRAANVLSGENFDRWVREFNNDVFGTEAGRLLSLGLPTAVGTDISSRVSLGQLYMLDLKTDTAESTIGSLAAGFGGPLLNLGMGMFNGMRYINEGQVAKGMEAFLPKGAKDIFKWMRYSNEGLTDATGKEIVGAEKMEPQELFLQALGFQPARVSEAYAGRAAIKDRQSAEDKSRSLLMRRYNNAGPDERQEMLTEIMRWNRDHPAARITRSQLLRGLKDFRSRELRTSQYGVDLQGADRTYLETGEPYEVE